jgi:CBS domain-containing protein
MGKKLINPEDRSDAPAGRGAGIGASGGKQFHGGSMFEDTVEFLKSVPPFQDLDEETLRSMTNGMTIEFYPKGSTILYQEGPASDYLRVIKKGTVRVSVKSGKDEEVLIDTRSEGNSFGFLSLVSGDKSRANVVATEDTICYLISRETVLKLLEANPAFAEYFLVSYLNKYIDKTYTEMRKKSILYGGGDKVLFSTPVGELITKEVITASQEISIREAAMIMSEQRISSVVLVDEKGVPVGIVTDRDLRDKVVSRSRDVTDAVKNIMTVSLLRIDARDYCFEALLKMIQHSVHHLLIIDSGKLKGVITNHDLMMVQGTSPVSVAREIESQQTIEGLVPVSGKTNKLVGLLLKEGAKASNITRIITEVNDRLVRKVLEIAEKKLGPPPVDYCWIAFGSEGRKEQTFKTDQDNAIIYADPDTPEKEEQAKTYFSKFSLLARDGLVKCGFPLCTGDYMASNPMWRQPLRVWKGYFSKWINTPTSEALLFSVILFDYRPLFGNYALAEELRDHLTDAAQAQDMFLKQLADMTVSIRSPLGLFKTFLLEKSGPHKGELNIKFKCIAPVIDIVRLYSLEKGVRATSTLERIDALRAVHGVVKELGDELEQAFDFFSLLRVHHQFDQIETGLEPDNFINPYKMSSLDQKMLKESCQLISRIQDMITKQYSPGRVL